MSHVTDGLLTELQTTVFGRNSIWFYGIPPGSMRFYKLWLVIVTAGFQSRFLWGSVWFHRILLDSIWFYGYSFVFDFFPRVSMAFFCILSGPALCIVILLYSGYLVMNSAYKRRFLLPLSLSFLFFLLQTISSGSIGDNYNQYYVVQIILSSSFFSRIPHCEFTG